MTPEQRPGGSEPEPHLHPTKTSTLILTALCCAVLGWVATRHYYADFPALPWFGSMALLLLGFIEFFTGRAIKQRLSRKPGTEPVEPLLVARLAALAKASCLVGAVYAGAFAGIGLWLVTHSDGVRAVEKDVPMAGFGVLAGIIVVGGALWLEYACRIPPEPPQHVKSE